MTLIPKTTSKRNQKQNLEIFLGNPGNIPRSCDRDKNSVLKRPRGWYNNCVPKHAKISTWVALTFYSLYKHRSRFWNAVIPIQHRYFIGLEFILVYLLTVSQNDTIQFQTPLIQYLTMTRLQLLRVGSLCYWCFDTGAWMIIPLLHYVSLNIK